MPSLLRSLRVALVALLACLAFAGPAGAQSPFGHLEVEVVSPKGESASIWLDEIANPEDYGTYEVRDPRGPRDPVVIEKGYGISVRQILEETGRDLGFGVLELDRPNGSRLRLSKDYITTPQYSSTIYVKPDGTTWFIRRSKGPGDYNAVDHFQVPTGVLRIEQTPPTRTVSIKASRKKIDPGESVTFTAEVSGGIPSAKYTFDWNFNDGKRIADGKSRETHTFTEAGRYEVLLAVTLDGETRSDAGVVAIQVGDPADSDKDRAGGGDNTAGTGDSGTVTGGAGAGTTYGTDSGSTYTPSPPPPPTPTPSDPVEPDLGLSGTTVEGNLLADASDPPPTSLLESAARAARDGKQRDDGPDGAGVPEAALSVAGVLALLGLGAGIETRQGRRPRLRLRLPRRGA